MLKTPSIRALHSEDLPKEAIAGIRLNTNKTVAVYLLYLQEESNTPLVEIIPPHYPHSFTKEIPFLENDLQSILLYCIDPHEKYSFKVQIQIVSIDTNTPLEALSFGIAATLISTQISMKDTPVTYTHSTDKGSIWIVKGYYTDKIINMQVSGEIDKESLLKSSQYKPTKELEAFVQRMANV
ncbi:hypothetical protein NEOKW01_0892 [Nematocida sp. AWRm80]|nr:hypothetical protein NEOKW01_0892 [Nematocida sp. AWRm80]